MSRSPELYQWRTEIAKHFPHLSQPMVMGLNTYQFRITGRCSLDEAQRNPGDLDSAALHPGYELSDILCNEELIGGEPLGPSGFLAIQHFG